MNLLLIIPMIAADNRRAFLILLTPVFRIITGHPPNEPESSSLSTNHINHPGKRSLCQQCHPSSIGRTFLRPLEIALAIIDGLTTAPASQIVIFPHIFFVCLGPSVETTAIQCDCQLKACNISFYTTV